MCSAELHLCREAPLTMAAWTCSSIAFKAPTWALHLGDDVLQRRGGRQRSSQDGRCINQPRFELGLICSALRLHILPLEVVRGPFHRDRGSTSGPRCSCLAPLQEGVVRQLGNIITV